MAAVEVIADLAIVAGCVVGLWYGASRLVEAAVRIARRVGLSELVIGLTIVAIGTSAPEFAVSVDAALEGRPDIAVGNVVGSNAFNVGLILGGAALLRAIPAPSELVRRDGTTVIATTLLVAWFLADGTVARWEGLALLGLLVGYIGYLLRGTTPAGTIGTETRTTETRAADTEPEAIDGEPKAIGEEFRPSDLLWLSVGLTLVVVSGHFLVASASALARLAGVSEWVIGVTVVAVGTSTPELATSLVAASRGSHGVSAGNLLGSNVFNLLGVLGLAAAIEPMTVGPNATVDVGLLAGQMIVVVALLWSGRRLSRPEGTVLVGLNLALWVAFALG